MGSIYKRGNVWWIKYHRRGAAYYESSKSTKKTVARRILGLREGEIAAGKLPGVLFERITFDELAEDMKTDYRINRKKSLKKVEQGIKLHLHPLFGGLRVPEITTSLVGQYVEKRLGEGAANGTINRELAHLKRMLNLGA